MEGTRVIKAITNHKKKVGGRANNRAFIVLSIVFKITVKEVNINSKIFYINVVIVIVIEVGSAFTLIVTPYYTRLRTTRFCATSQAVDKGIIIYK